MRKFLSGSLVICLFASCKEDSTHYTAKLVNATKHNVIVLYYINGIVNTNDTIKLVSSAEMEIANGVDRGLVTGPSFKSKYGGGPNDSLVVIFDYLYRVTHYYTMTPVYLSPKYYLPSSLRHIRNPNSYKFQSSKINNHSNFNTHEYTFTEDDYLYAK